MQNKNADLGKEIIVFIINPISGIGNRDNMNDIIIKNLDLQRFTPKIYKTKYKGHATRIARESIKNGVKKIIAVGGDGTVNEVATALVGTKCALGIIPNGSGNGLARYLGIPVEHYAAVKYLNHAQSKKIDVGKINSKYFFCTCGLGFDAHVGKVFDKLNGRGFLNYIKTVLKEFLSYKSKKYKFCIDGKKYKEKAFLITFANAGQYGSNAYISPGARIDDGLLDICVFKPFPKIKSLFLGLRLFNRTMDKSKYLQVIHGKEILIRRKKKTTIHIDGDPVKMKKNIKIRIIAKALKVILSE